MDDVKVALELDSYDALYDFTKHEAILRKTIAGEDALARTGHISHCAHYASLRNIREIK